MNHAERKLLRLAQKIHEANAAPAALPKVPAPTSRWDEFLRLVRRQGEVQARGWTAAAGYLGHELDATLENLQSELTVCRKALCGPPAEVPFASPREIVADLLALQNEFVEFDYCLKSKSVTAVTEAIAFQGIELGRFAIELRWERLRPFRWGCYSVIAQAPNPAGSDESITHPHVQAEGLCEGDAGPAIRKALAEGRLLDFFLIVRSVLETYNASSPYVPIEDWEGVCCEDCDARIVPSEANGCINCGRRICDGCHSYCPSCEDGFCYECRADCQVCEETYCSNCLEPCAACGGRTACVTSSGAAVQKS